MHQNYMSNLVLIFTLIFDLARPQKFDNVQSNRHFDKTIIKLNYQIKLSQFYKKLFVFVPGYFAIFFLFVMNQNNGKMPRPILKFAFFFFWTIRSPLIMYTKFGWVCSNGLDFYFLIPLAPSPFDPGKKYFRYYRFILYYILFFLFF